MQAVKSQRNRLCDRHRGRATTDVCWCSPESNDPRSTAQPAPEQLQLNQAFSIKLSSDQVQGLTRPYGLS